jgi:CheY-like chemotaxis protein
MRGDISFSEQEGDVLVSIAIPFALEREPAHSEAAPPLRLDAPAPVVEPTPYEHSSALIVPAASVASAPLAQPEPELEAPAQQLKILVAEDNRINQNTLLRILKRHHHRVTLATNGKDAVEKAQQESYDLIFMDCQMPQLDGYQATRAIRKHEETRGVRSTIVGMSAHLDMDGRERCLNSGMDEYMSKPIQEDKIVETIRKLFP